MRVRIVLITVGLLALLGCGDGSRNSPPRTFQERAPDQAAPGPLPDAAGGEGLQQQMMARGGKPAPAAQPQAVKGGDAPAAVPRKIIRTATVDLVVEDFDTAEQGLKQLLAQHPDAYLAQAETTGSAGSPRHGTWRIRVPVAAFDPFLTELTRLGVPRKNVIDSKDVSEEYYDLAARIKNQKVEEARLLAHLEKSTGKLEEILAVEKEISRVRGEIERQEGRIRLLDNLTALTTITLTMQELKNYTPAPPSFGQDIRAAFSGSIDLLVAVGKAVVLVAVALGPWLPVVALLAVPAVWYQRRSRQVTS